MTTATATPPARGSLESGWNKIVRDFDAAVLDAPFSALELFLIGKARFASWTLSTLGKRARDEDPEPLPFRLDLHELAARKGVNHRYLSGVFRGLVAKRVFEPAPDAAGFFLIVKDYSRWVEPAASPDGEPTPLLSEAQIADADGVRDDLVASVEAWAAVAKGGRISCPPRQKNLRIEAEKSAARAEKPAPEGRKTCPEAQEILPRHIGTPARSERPRDQETPETGRGRVTVRSGRTMPEPVPAADDHEPTGTPEPQKPMQTGRCLGIVNRPPASEPIANTPAEVERAADYARKTWGEAGEASARSDCEDFWAVDVLEAMKRATAAGARGYAYAAKVLRGWWADTGGKPKHVPACKLGIARVRPEDAREVLSDEEQRIEERRAAAFRRRMAEAEARRALPIPA